MEYSREDKLIHAKNIQNSSEWQWYKSELEDFIRMKDFNINYKVDPNMMYNAGVIAGIKWCLDFPAKTEKNNLTILNRMREIVGIGEK